MVLRRMKVEDATVHGFRFSFRDWAGNRTNFPREVVETALAHVVGDRSEQAYRRSDALEKHRKLMEAWAQSCSARPGATVLPLRRKAHARLVDGTSKSVGLGPRGQSCKSVARHLHRCRATPRAFKRAVNAVASWTGWRCVRRGGRWVLPSRGFSCAADPSSNDF